MKPAPCLLARAALYACAAAALGAAPLPAAEPATNADAIVLLAPAPEEFAAQLKAFTAGRKVKLLALASKTGLPHIIDLAALQATPLGPDNGCNRPHWHPDGTNIIYSTAAGVIATIKADGAARTALPFLGWQARWWFEPSDGAAWVLYTKRDAKDWYHKGIGRGRPTLRSRLSDGETIELLDYSFDGGLSLDGTHLAEAYGGLYIADLAAGQVHTLIGGKQACNASISPDNTHRVMYLALPHKYIAIRDKTDRILWQAACPPGYFEWQTPRWSTHPDFAACTLARGPEGPYRICLIRIPTKTFLLVPLDGDWSLPGFWVEGGPRPDMGRRG